ncbi:ferrous iron transport protein A [Mycoplasmatota bacterium]|nr:ferrous iron transport protein A [Mycoplasmatota bacterium]
MTQKLSTCNANVQYRITGIEGDSDIKRFFKHVGINEGSTFKLVNVINKHFIIYIKGSRYAMEKALAAHVMVEADA